MAANIGNRVAKSSVLEFLLQAGSYPDATSRVELIETHISWVFLTDDFVYKLKKPVRFEFVDFSTVEQRQAACLQEVELNRRLSPDVYLGAIPITADPQTNYRVGGTGEVVDWVVKMNRLPADRALDRLVKQRQVTDQLVRQLADRLADFYAQSKPIRKNPDEYLHNIDRHEAANAEELSKGEHQFDARLVRRLHSAQKRFLTLAGQQLLQRALDGRVVDGHGDLRPEHIYFAPTPKIIDCLEFSSELRTVDVADELAFLAMECDRLGAAHIGQKVLESHVARNRDPIPRQCVEFFKCYRACVRAKVLALRARQLKASDAERMQLEASEYLQLADRSARQLGPPIVLLVRGVSGTGKSAVASLLAKAFGCSVLGTDKVRRQIVPQTGSRQSFNEGQYSADRRRQVYETLFQQADDQLAHKLSVVLDGTFLTADLRQSTVQLAQDHQAQVLLIHCRCPASVAMERIRARGLQINVESDARPEFVERQLAEEEPDRPGWPTFEVDTTQDLDRVGRLVEDRVRPLIINEEFKSKEVNRK